MEFKVNEYITLKLEEDKTVMYINEEEYNLCCGVLVNIPQTSPRISFKNQESIDYIVDSNQYKTTEDENIRKKINPEEEFWAFCSNLQVWAENNYNSDFLHYTVVFPLLDKLIQAGDPLAKEVFQKEMLRRIKYGTYYTTSFLEFEGYLDKLTLTNEELIRGVLVPDEADALVRISNRTDLKYVIGTNFDDDEIRERPLYKNLMDPKLYITIENGHLCGLEIELTKDNPRIPEEIKVFNHLWILHIWVTDSKITVYQPSFKLESVSKVKIIMHKSVIFLPHLLYSAFPNLEQPMVSLADYSVKPRKRTKKLKKIDNSSQDYRKQLFLIATVDDLKQICLQYQIKGFSKLRKSDLAEFVLTSLSEEELKNIINMNEEKWILKWIDSELNKIIRESGDQAIREEMEMWIDTSKTYGIRKEEAGVVIVKLQIGSNVFISKRENFISIMERNFKRWM